MSYFVDFGGNVTMPSAFFSALKDLGITGIIMDTFSPASNYVDAMNAGLEIGLFQGYDSQAFSQLSQAQSRALLAVNVAEHLGYPHQGTIFLDAESSSSSDLENWVKTWCQTVESHGFTAGIYQGASFNLSQAQWDALAQDYVVWKSASQVPYISTGYVAAQIFLSQNIGGQTVDLDVVMNDFKSRKVLFGSKSLTASQTQAQPQAQHQEKNMYTVQKGDTLIGIASKFGTTYQELAKLNHIANPNFIEVGERIQIG